MKVFITIIMTMLSMSCVTTSSEVPLFQVEPNMKSTVSPIRHLEPGDTLRFTFDNLKINEVFHVQKCGPQCNTARLVAHWHGECLCDNHREIFTIMEGGEYYFWIRHTLEGGETGPVFIESSKISDSKFKVIFASGTEVTIELSAPNKHNQRDAKRAE